MGYTPNYALRLTDYKTYAFAFLFVVGNLLLPQVCHLIPQGGLIFLPIYFFTLVGAFRFGINVGMMTAVFSPLANCILFGMPPVAALPAILIKSVALAFIASYLSNRFKHTSLALVATAVVGYQIVGMSFEFVSELISTSSVGDSFYYAIQDVRLGFPGLLLQIVGGYFIIKYLEKFNA